MNITGISASVTYADGTEKKLWCPTIDDLANRIGSNRPSNPTVPGTLGESMHVLVSWASTVHGDFNVMMTASGLGVGYKAASHMLCKAEKYGLVRRLSRGVYELVRQ